MVRLQCPQCGTTIEAQPGQQAACPSCGFSAQAPGLSAPASPSASSYSATPYGGSGGSYSPPAGPTPYQAPPPGYAQQQMPKTNGLAVAALVMGILGFCIGITSILAIVFGVIARNQIKERHEAGDGMALAGIILGAIVVGLGILYFIFFFAFFGTFMGDFLEPVTGLLVG